MASPDYASLVAAAVDTLRNDIGMDGVYVTDDPSPLTEMQCPGVRVQFGGFSLDPTRIGRPDLATPYDETIRLTFDCVTFSVESAGDAARQRDRLVRLVRDALARDYTLGGRVLLCMVTGGEALGGEEAGMHSGMRLSAVCQTMT